MGLEEKITKESHIQSNQRQFASRRNPRGGFGLFPGVGEHSLAVKLIMKWDILVDREREYFEFIVREFIPGVATTWF